VKVITTPKASRDLEEWISRIATENLPAAESFLGRIRQTETPVGVIERHFFAPFAAEENLCGDKGVSQFD
jgi:hypothetical protein